MSRWVTCTLTAALLLAICLPALSHAQRVNKGAFSIRGGFIFAGEVTGTYKQSGFRFSLDNETSYSLGITLEEPVWRDVRIMLAVDIHDAKFGESFSVSKSMMNGSLGLVYPLHLRQGPITLRPGALFGLGLLPEWSAGFLEIKSTQYFTIRPFLEVAVNMAPKVAFLVELSLFMSPSGGNSDVDVEFGPNPLIRFGLLF